MSAFSWMYFKHRVTARLLRPFLWLTLLLKWLVYLVSASVSLTSLGLILLLLWLFASEPGGGWLLRQLPGVEVEDFSGNLVSDWQAERLSWSTATWSVQLDELEVAWQPSCLLAWKVCVQAMQAKTLAIQLGEGSTEDPKQPWRMPELDLPELKLPLPLQVTQLNVQQLQINQRDQVTHIELRDAVWQATRLEWQQLFLKSPWLPLDDRQPLEAHGWLDFSGDWPLQLNLAASLFNQPVTAKLGGSLQVVELESLRTRGPDLEIQGQIQLLTGHLPVQLQARLLEQPLTAFWEWPKEGVPQGLETDDPYLLLDVLDLKLQGDLEAGWQLEGWSQLLWGQLALLHDWTAQLDWQGVQLTAEQLAADPDYHLSAQAQFDWMHLVAAVQQDWAEVQGQLEIDARHLSLGPQPWLDLFKVAPQWPLLEDQLQLKARLKQGSLELDGHLQGKKHWSDSTLQLETQWSAQMNLLQPTLSQERVAGMQVPDWARRLDMDFKTRLSGEFQHQAQGYHAEARLDGRWQGAELVYGLDLSRLNLQGQQGEHLDARVKLNSELWQLSLAAHFIEVQPWLQAWWPDVEGDLVLNANSSLPAPASTELLAFQPEALVDWLLQGDYRVRASSAGLIQPSIKATETALAFEYAGSRSNELGQQLVSLRWFGAHLQLGDHLIEAPQARLHGSLAQHQLYFAAGRAQEQLLLSLDGRLHQGIDGGARLEYALDPWSFEALTPFLPDNLRWQGQLQGALQLQGFGQGLAGSMRLWSEQGRLSVLQQNEDRADEDWQGFDYQQLALQLELDPNHLQVEFLLEGEAFGQSELVAQLALQPAASSGQRSLSGQYHLEGVQLQLLSPWLELDELSGWLSGQGVLKGHLLAPEVWGELHLAGAVVRDLEWPVNLEHLDASLLIEANQVWLQGDFQAGRRGEGQLEGHFSWQDQPQGQLAIQGQRIDIRVEPWAGLVLEPDLRLSYREGEVHLGGRLAVPSGQVRVQQRPRQAVRVSSDARVRGRPEPEPGLMAGFSMDVELLIGRDRIQLDAFGLQADLQGRLRMSDDLETRGELLLVNGRFQSWGQDLRLRRARVYFIGPLDQPFLDIEAVRDIAPGVVGIRMTGSAEQPETEIFSEPPMSSEQALSWLLTGAPLEAETDLNALALSAGLAGIAGFTEAAGRAVGIREFELTAEGEGDETTLVAAGYLNRRLSVRYGVGIYEEISRVAVRYELTRQLYIEVVSSIENSLDIFWEVDY